MEECVYCKGTGLVEPAHVTCPVCKGVGEIDVVNNDVPAESPDIIIEDDSIIVEEE